MLCDIYKIKSGNIYFVGKGLLCVIYFDIGVSDFELFFVFFVFWICLLEFNVKYNMFYLILLGIWNIW